MNTQVYVVRPDGTALEVVEGCTQSAAEASWDTLAPEQRRQRWTWSGVPSTGS